MRSFVTMPFRSVPEHVLRDAHREFRRERNAMNERVRKLAPGGLAAELERHGVGARRDYGLLVDMEGLAGRALRSGHTPVSRTMLELFNLAEPKPTVGAMREVLAAIGQLTSMGHKVNVQDLGKAEHIEYLSKAREAGAGVRPADAEVVGDSLTKGKESAWWARDQYTKIGDAKERPSVELAPKRPLTRIEMLMGASPPSTLFGEGGMMVQVGPKEFAVSELVTRDPRVKDYEKKGWSFHPMPFGIHPLRTMSDMLDMKIYNRTSHIDFNLGGIPELKVLAVCPRYYKENGEAVDALATRFGLRKVMVPAEEADRHPANFLPLGGGKVLVDSGSPKFIKRLEKAGVTVVPTAAPLDNLPALKGGIRCMFNEE